MFRFWVLSLLTAVLAMAHAPPTPLAQPPLQVRGTALLGADGYGTEFAGVTLPELKTAVPVDPLVFRILRQRWNVNIVRLPISVAAWRQSREEYFQAVWQTLENANQIGLVVVLAARDNTSLPTAGTVEFWRTWAIRFKDKQRVIFDIFDRPSVAEIAGNTPSQRSRRDWQRWHDAMSNVVTAIRSTGASQVIAVQSFDDELLFEAFDATTDSIADGNVIYAIRAPLDRVRTPGERQSRYGFLAATRHVYAAEWGLPNASDITACRSLPANPTALTQAVYDQLGDFQLRGMSWTVSSFEPGSLIVDAADRANTTLDRPWTCPPDASQGIGEAVLLWLTGDPTGFGELRADAITNAATFLAGPIAPGEILSIYGLEIGPYPGVESRLGPDGRIPSSVAGVQVLFDGIPAPIFFTSAFQVNVQVPYSIAPNRTTRVQLLYNDVSSSKIDLPVVEASPGIFADFTREAKALNQNGSLNTQSSPAESGSIVVLFANGTGRLTSPRPEGTPASGSLGAPVLPVSVRIAGQPAQILYAGEAPGLAGVTQINLQLPTMPASDRPVARRVELNVGPYSDTSGVTLWVR